MTLTPAMPMSITYAPQQPKFGLTKKVAVVELKGMIAGDGKISDAGKVISQLREVGLNKKTNGYEGLIFKINSPGGTPGTSEEIHDTVMELREKHKLPVVVAMGDLAASGGFWAAMSGDKIVAHGTTTTGSIGVVTQLMSTKKLMEKVGVEMKKYTAGENKAAFDVDEIEKSDEKKALLINHIKDIHNQFIETVAKGRKLTVENVRKFADGRVFTGKVAKELGLVDELGGTNKAAEVMKSLLGLKAGDDVQLVEVVSPKPDLFENLKKISGLLKFFKTGVSQAGSAQAENLVNQVVTTLTTQINGGLPQSLMDQPLVLYKPE